LEDARLACQQGCGELPRSVLRGTEQEIIRYTIALLETGMAGGRFLLTFSETCRI